jgi:hypothetical protein
VPTSTFTTTNGGNFLIASCSSQQFSGGVCGTTTGTNGWTFIAANVQTGGSGNLQSSLFYKPVTTVLTSDIETFQAGSIGNWLTTGDAISGNAGCH